MKSLINKATDLRYSFNGLIDSLLSITNWLICWKRTRSIIWHLVGSWGTRILIHSVWYLHVEIGFSLKQLAYFILIPSSLSSSFWCCWSCNLHNFWEIATNTSPPTNGSPLLVNTRFLVPVIACWWLEYSGWCLQAVYLPSSLFNNIRIVAGFQIWLFMEQ